MLAVTRLPPPRQVVAHRFDAGASDTGVRLILDTLARYRLEGDVVATSHSSTAFTIDEAAETDDVARELEGARDKGIALIDQHPRAGLAGMICFLHPKATHGVLVEYAEPIED